MTDGNSRWLWLSFSMYLMTLVAGTLFSFTFTDPNLVLLQNHWYWQAQQWLWHTWFDHPLFQAQTYITVVTAQWLGFSWFAWQLRRLPVGWFTLRRVGMLVAAALGVTLFAYNALSHDLFNYIFNARMVWLYHVDPQTHVALEFTTDPWLRFMHNTHTTAPYGYGWTLVSLLPYGLGGGRFVVTWLLFRVMAVLGLFSTGLIIWHWLNLSNRQHRRWLLVALCLAPFTLAELVMSAHNDMWMLLPAVAGMYVLDRWQRKGGWRQLLLALGFVLLSVTVKYASLVLLPIIGVVVLIRWLKRGKHRPIVKTTQLALLASIALFVPLLSARSQYFHPWYLSWALLWLPLVDAQWWLILVGSFMISSTYRYVPWISTGGFTGDVVWYQQLVTWVGGFTVAAGVWFALGFRPRGRA